MDAVAYQMSFDKEQLALLCANYDRRIDSLGAENKRLKAESDKLRELARDAIGAYEGLVKLLPDSPTKNAAERAVSDLHERAHELGIVV